MLDCNDQKTQQHSTNNPHPPTPPVPKLNVNRTCWIYVAKTVGSLVSFVLRVHHRDATCISDTWLMIEPWAQLCGCPKMCNGAASSQYVPVADGICLRDTDFAVKGPPTTGRKMKKVQN
ncbi:hypothetical protein ACA910_020092 [Epithemia clementina (nom. ined.)]